MCQIKAKQIKQLSLKNLQYSKRKPVKNKKIPVTVKAQNFDHFIPENGKSHKAVHSYPHSKAISVGTIGIHYWSAGVRLVPLPNPQDPLSKIQGNTSFSNLKNEEIASKNPNPQMKQYHLQS